ncbi:MAG: triose-phosphate isomerase [Chitinophagaceae bacterium]
MRKQIAAANWKMNLPMQQAKNLVREVLQAPLQPEAGHLVVFAVPFPYLVLVKDATALMRGFAVAAQNCHHKKGGAYTGEVSAEMLHSMEVKYCIIGHSERREYFHESNAIISEKVNICLEHDIHPIFCCGEPLHIRDANSQNEFVQAQLQESLFHLSKEELKKIIIAYEPIWAIGTGKTASTEQAQEMHQFIRSVLSNEYGAAVANEIPILYGGSVKAANAAELFNCPDVDGGLVGGASLVAQDFVDIIKALKI